MEDSGNNGKYNRWYLLINLSHSIPLNGDVLERFWIRKNVSYDYLNFFFFFCCKVFVGSQSSVFLSSIIMKNLGIDSKIWSTRKSPKANILNFLMIKSLQNLMN